MVFTQRNRFLWRRSERSYRRNSAMVGTGLPKRLYRDRCGISRRKDPLGHVLDLRAYQNVYDAFRKDGGSGIVFNLPAGYSCPAPLLRFTTSCETSAGSYTGQGRCYVSGGSVVIDFAPANSQYHDVSAVEFDTATVTAMPTGPAGPTGPQGATGGNATVPIEAWRIVGAAGQPAFLGGWAASNGGAGYQAPSFRKDPLGRVWIRGSFGGSPTVAHAFTLPAGYAPTAIFAFDTLLDNGIAGGYVSIDTLGQVSLQRGSSASIYVDVSFDSGTVTAMPTGPTGPPGPAAVITPSDPFHIVGAAGEPAYKNAWTALDTRGARFRKYKDGIVRLSGAMNVGTISTAAFTLPSGYRPAVEGYYPVIANGVHGGVIVGVNGDVIPFAPMAAGYCFVAGIQFDTEGGS
jgi:hypothetical protein